MSKVIIGTSGYAYKDWVGVLYSQATKPTDYLRVYAQEFGVAELNFSYYRMPDASMTKRMAAVTPTDFLFSIKAHKTLTHEISSHNLTTESKMFLKGIEPIKTCGKLGVVLLQFPFSFHYNSSNRTYLDKLYDHFKEVPLAVEFRNHGWQTESVYGGFVQRKMSYVNVDEPALPGLLSASAIVTSPVGYIRFHGRNKENWWYGDNVSRYDYLYSDAELVQWIPRIESMKAQSTTLLVVFNNHSKGQAVQNARRLKKMLGGDEPGVSES